jgi:fibronectin type 3 domain-containing protein
MKRFVPILLFYALIAFFSGCQNPAVPQKPTVDPNLPVISDIKSLSDITQIALEWSPTHNSNVEGYRIYRAKADDNSGVLERIATIDNKYTSHFTDKNLAPNTFYIYKISTFSKDKRESNPSETIRISTKGAIEPIPFVQAVVGLPGRIKLIWRPHPSERVSAYIIERNDFSSSKWSHLATVEGRLSAEYIDNSLSDSKSYRYRIIAKTYDGVLSAPSQTVEAQTKPLPPIVENPRTTNNLPRKILISWDASSYQDISHYNVYRANFANLFYTLLIKTRALSYEDIINDDGTAKYYYVTVTDKDGLESPRQAVPVMGSTLEAPSAPTINVIKHDIMKVLIGWNDTSNRAVKYQIERVSKNGTLTYTNVMRNTFIDNDVSVGVKYVYTVYAVDKYGLISKPSLKAVITIPDTAQN